MFRFLIFDRDWKELMDRKFSSDGTVIVVEEEEEVMTDDVDVSSGKSIKTIKTTTKTKTKTESMQLCRGLVHSMSNLMAKTQGNEEEFVVECTKYDIYFFSSPLTAWKFVLLKEVNVQKPSTKKPPTWIAGCRREDVLRAFYLNCFAPFHSQSPFVGLMSSFDKVQSFTDAITDFLPHFPCK